MNPNEKRACRRYAMPGVTTQVLESTLIGPAQYGRSCPVENVSKGGVLFQSSHQYKVGAMLDIGIQGPATASPIFTEAEVCYKKADKGHFHYGVRFAQINVQTLRKIRQLCA